MSVIIGPRAARRPRRFEAGASAHPVRHARDGAALQPAHSQVRQDHRRRAWASIIRTATLRFTTRLVRMAQDFSLRYPLVDGQGNFGSIDGDPPAAKRYTEARLSRIAAALLEDIDKETVDFRPNYDEQRSRARSPAHAHSQPADQRHRQGIAVGMATKIPPHNLTEIIDASHSRWCRTPPPRCAKSWRSVQGPDFPTGGFILGRTGHSRLFHHRPRLSQAARQGRHRKDRQGSRGHHRHRDPLPGEQSPPDRRTSRRW